LAPLRENFSSELIAVRITRDSSQLEDGHLTKEILLI